MIAALVAVSPRSAVYQMMYPIPEVTAPEITAHIVPIVVMCSCGRTNNTVIRTKGIVRIKLSVVTATGFELPRPRSEYIPQEMPAIAINPELLMDGASRPGDTR